MLVRPMTRDDAERVAALTRELGYGQVSADQVAQRFAEVAVAGNALFVVEHDGELIGWAHVRVVAQLQRHRFASMDAIVVAKPWRRQGVGKALLDACKRWADGQDCDGLRLP